MLRSLFALAALLLAAPAQAQQSAPSPERQAAEAEQYFVRGMTRAYIGDYEEAVTFYERALDLAPDEAAVLAALAEAHEALGDATSALFFASRAVDAAPDEPSGYRHLAGLQLGAGDTNGALRTYQRLLAVTPNDIGVITALARIQQQSGRLDEALATYEDLLRRVGESEAVRVRMLAIYQRQGDRAGEIRTLEALLALDPENAALQRELAGRYREAGDTERADALSLDSPNSEGSDASNPSPAKSETVTPSGPADEPEAAAQTAEALARALADDPRNPPGWAELVAAHLRAGDTDAALDAADEALLLFPGQYALVRAAARANLEAGNDDDARRLFTEALVILEEEAPGDTSERSALLEGLGDAEAARGRTDDARRHWQAARDLLPADRSADRQRLDNKLAGAP